MEYLILAAIIFVAYKVFDTRCPNCNKFLSRTHIGSEEIDRWTGTKKVEVEIKTRDPKFNTERKTGSRTEYVPCTFVKIAHYYSCNHCGHEWYRTKKKELK